jgi:hypothetical protein
MIDDALAAELGRHWEDGWNSHDVDLIMAPFADAVVFSSPFVSRYTGSPSKTTIDGHDALRAYVIDGLQRAPLVRYTLNDTYLSTDTLVLLYTFRVPDGPTRPGVDLMRVDGDDKVDDWRSHYQTEFIRAVLGN